MLTLYYASTTYLQAWRIQRIFNKITEQLSQKASVSFYALQSSKDDGFDVACATSELCINRDVAKVTEILWMHENLRGCTLRPPQFVHITPWISFPEAPSWLPFAYGMPTVETLQLSTDRRQHLNLMLEASIEPKRSWPCTNAEPLKLEQYGKLIAWKIDSHLAVLLESDVEHFTQFLIASYMRQNLLINDHLPLLRIETVHYEGNPQPFAALAKHLRRSTRNSAALNETEWQRHLDDLRALGVLAHQATEFEQNKNRTEAKAGIAIKPDLIPAELKAAAIEDGIKPTKSIGNLREHATPKKLDTDVKIKPEVTKIKVDNADGKPNTIKVSETAKKSASPLSTASKVSATSQKTSPAKQGECSELERLAAELAAQQRASQTPSPAPATADVNTTTVDAEQPKATAPIENKAAVDKTPKKQAEMAETRNGKLNTTQSAKPLNILVYSETATARESTLATLRDVVQRDTYAIYALNDKQVMQKHWLEHTALLVICGSVQPNVGEVLVDYFLHGGKLLSLCSNILHFILPNYRTAEVRENELAQFSYDKWQKVKMMHHIFCYQPSPVKKHFSTDSEESSHSRKPSVQLTDLLGQTYRLDVQVLGTEETWNTPSLLLAKCLEKNGKAVFSQVHLETSPREFEADETKFAVLKQSDKSRLEIFANLLCQHLEILVQLPNVADPVATSGKAIAYQPAHLLGRHETKFELLEKLKPRFSSNNVLSTPQLAMKFYDKDEKPHSATDNTLPILVHSCPEDFSTVLYFENLKTEHIGRLVIYAPIINSSMNVVNNLELLNGIAVIVRQQTAGVGRSNNQWLSPRGCTMFSLQLHVCMDSTLGTHLPLMQHLVSAAVVNMIKGSEIYKVLDVSLKWPNDIYANRVYKIGGVIATTTILGSEAIVNIGCGVNLDNDKPTICINDLIREYNKAHNKSLPLLKYEEFIAKIFNEMERIIEIVQNDDIKLFYDLYYSLWLHNNQNIKICTEPGREQEATIIGIDEYGYLKVQLTNGAVESVQPDGNTFDMLKGLIVPKYP